jgi:hypothetical protein
MERLRSIIQSEQFTLLCGEISSDVRRLDEQLRGVEWSIARRPESFTQISGNFYVVETFMPVEGDDYVFIYYTIDDESTCTLRWIEAGNAVVAVEDTTTIDVP